MKARISRPLKLVNIEPTARFSRERSLNYDICGKKKSTNIFGSSKNSVCFRFKEDRKIVIVES